MALPVVETRVGKVRGTTSGPVQAYRGIPFARPPVGQLRFRAPQPAEPWAGVREAAGFGPVAPQEHSPLENMLGSAALVYDEATCLTLNVWTPAADGGRRPVMVWVHGGAFVTGSGSTPWYDGTNFAAHHDVVVVTVNYRLGALGFLHLGELLGDEYSTSGNVGILDQVAALRWVADNIAAFGGDPGNVTIFGESAGGMSVGTLLAAPAAAGLFRRAVPQSGAGHNAQTVEQADRTARAFLDHLGVAPGEAARLLDVPVERLLQAQSAVTAAAGIGSGGLPFEPVVDGSVLPRMPVEEVAAGSASGVDLLVGSNLDEWKLFAMLDPRFNGLDDARLLEAAAALMPGADAEKAVSVYRRNRPAAAPAEVLGAMVCDHVFRIPAIRLAEAHASAGNPARMYLFQWPTPVFGGALGSCHALEIPFVFDNLDAPGAAMFCGPEAPRSLASAMNAAWARFARSGDPSGGELGAWPGYGPEGRPTMVFDVRPRLDEDPMGEERILWEGLR